MWSGWTWHIRTDPETCHNWVKLMLENLQNSSLEALPSSPAASGGALDASWGVWGCLGVILRRFSGVSWNLGMPQVVPSAVLSQNLILLESSGQFSI